MDEPQYSTLMDALSGVPDPRKARGKQFSWILLLTLVSSALASGERSGHGIASWVAEHAAALLVWLRPERERLPSESTLRRAAASGCRRPGATPGPVYLPNRRCSRATGCHHQLTGRNLTRPGA